MQKLSRKLKNVPGNTSLVPCPTSSSLNRVKKLSVKNKVLLDNNSEENLRQHRAGSDLRVLNIVCVLNKRGLPLMPTCQSKARRLLKSRKAKVVKRYPFTIQLTTTTGETKQEVILGIDVGYKNVGISVINSKKELLSAEVTLRTNISELLSEKKMYRKHRRSKHHWYRKPKFLNRTKKEGWLAPSIRHKLDSHIKIIEKISNLFPISKIITETAKFDIQKIKNPKIKGKEYQQGEQLGFFNVREYVLYRDNHVCQHCKKKDLILNVHHIISRKTGGNRTDNLITLCKDCHEKYHKGKIKLDIKVKKDFKTETCMNMIRSRLIEKIKELGIKVEETYGYITKSKRIENKLEKSHINDAFIISGGIDQKRSYFCYIKQKRKNNRCLQINRKGFAPSIRKQRYKIQSGDLFWINSKKYVSKGMHSYGRYICYGSTKKKEYFKIEKVEKYFNQKSLI
jgi:hypothetical protein